MSGGLYGGDEVGALVFDPGHYSFRAGFAGEELPKAEIPSAVGFLPEEFCKDENKPPTTNQNGDSKIIAGVTPTGRKFYVDTNNIKHPRKNMEIGGYLRDSMVEDFEMFEGVVDHVFKYFNADSSLHPVLMSEDPLNTKTKREKLTEIMFEKYNVPAFYLCKTAVLATFASNRPSGLIVDSGATHTTAIPVYDGYCLTKAIVRIPLGGDAMTNQCRQYLDEANIDVVPPYMIAGKELVPENASARWTKKSNLPDVTKSFHNYMCKDVVQDFQASVLQVNDTPYDVEQIEKLSCQQHEFPNGYHQDFGAERYRIAEGLFDPSFLKNFSTPNPQMGVSNCVVASINNCDIDLKPALCGGIVVTGGNSLIPGFVDRLNYELSSKFTSNTKIKLHYAPSSAERRFASWIGGSILASLGSFQQLWISKQEYEETDIWVLQRAPTVNSVSTQPPLLHFSQSTTFLQ